MFDNISRIPDWLSDTLCRLATGGGFATRQLYADAEEALFDAMRPIILNGMEDFVIRSDLTDRSVFLNLENIPDNKRKAEKDFWADFDRAHPRILGALLDGVVHGLRQLPSTSLKEMPRMADFALWATACETAFWKAGTFAKAYKQNRDDALGVVIEADQVASAVQKFMEDKTEWKGTTSQLLVALKMDGAIPLDQTKLKEWPQTPEKLSRRLQRCAVTLRRAGIEVTRVKATDRGRARNIKIAKKGKGGNRPNRPNRPNSKTVNDLDADSMVNKPSDKPSEAFNQPFDQPSVKSDQPSATVQPDPCKTKVLDGSDGSDGSPPSSSGGTVLGFAQPGVRCDLCGKANIGESVMRIRLRGDVYDLHQHCADSYIIKMGWTDASVPPAFEVLGPAERGEKCALCREAKGANRIRIKRGVVTYVLHEECAPDYFAAHPDDDDGLGPT